jgi:hypothetical protein
MSEVVIDMRAYFEKIGYDPHRGQQQFHYSDARFRVACCGRRYGKSTMAARDMEPELLVPDRQFWIVGPTYDLGEKEFRIVYDDMIRKLGFHKDKRVKKVYNRRSGTMFIEFPWNTRIEVRSADHPENLVGEALDGVIMAEAAKHRTETWERYIRPALADKNGFATFCTTPEGHNWLFDLYMFGLDSDLPQYESWRMPSWENSAVYPGGESDPEIQLLRKTMSPEWFAQEIAAEFTSFVGKIYPEFDERLHVRRLEYRPELPNYVFWDWGFVNPLAALDVQVDAFDNVYIWREHYKPWIRLEEHIRYMLYERDNPEGYSVQCSYGDSADQEAIATVNAQFGPCIGQEEAKVNWRQGVEVVKRFLRARETGERNEHGEPVKKPMLFIDPSCVNTIKEFMNYKMAKAPRTGTSDAKEGPEKKDDHAMDALRYGLMHLFELGAKYHLEDVLIDPKEQLDLPRAGVRVDREQLGGGNRGIFTRGMEF